MSEPNNITELAFDNLAKALKNAENVIKNLGGEEAITPKLRAQINELYEYANQNKSEERKVNNGDFMHDSRQERKR